MYEFVLQKQADNENLWRGIEVQQLQDGTARNHWKTDIINWTGHWTGSHLLIALSGRSTRTVRMAVRFTVSSSSK